MIIVRTPFRISFFGGGTDFPSFFMQHGGAVLTSAINKYCYISIHHLAPLFKHRFQAGYSRTEMVQKVSEFQHPLIRETLLYLDQREGIEIDHVADLPGQTGLGSSSSFTVGLLRALHALRGNPISQDELARQAILIEREKVGDRGGWQDQYIAAYGGFRRIEFLSESNVQIHEVGMRSDRFQELQNCLMLFYMGNESSAASVLEEQDRRARKNERALLEMRQMVDHAECILSSGTSDLDAFGDLLHDSWMLKRSLSSGISNSQIDQAYAAARDGGARGGKLLGAGGRGFLCIYADPAQQDSVRKVLCHLQEVPFVFSAEGSRVIFQTSE